MSATSSEQRRVFSPGRGSFRIAAGLLLAIGAIAVMALLGVVVWQSWTGSVELVRVAGRYAVVKFDGEVRAEWVDEYTRLAATPNDDVAAWIKTHPSPTYAAWPFNSFRLRRLNYLSQNADGTLRAQTKWCAVASWRIAEGAIGVVSIFGLVLAWRGTRARRLSPGGCRACGYDLRASPARCPGCGRDVPTGVVAP